MRCVFFKIHTVLLHTLILIVMSSAPAWSLADEDMQTLEMFYEKKDLIVSATRNPQPTSQVAENLTIITAEEIEALNAHTLADVLNTIPGVQVGKQGGPGTLVFAFINGSDFRHILVLIDGVRQNSLTDNFADIGAFPVQNIERIEIIKGPASSSWGQALGGVINVVTKNPRNGAKTGGMLSASLGEKMTGDYRGEATGALGRFGYYLYAGNLTSDGLRPNKAVDENNLYTKFLWDIPEKGNLLFTLNYNRGSRGGGESSDFDFTAHDHYRYFFSTLALKYAFTNKLDMDISLRGQTKDADNTLRTFGGDLLQNVNSSETAYGASAKLIWRQRLNSLVVGVDGDHGEVDISNPINPAPTLSRNADQWGIFASDTFEIRHLAVTPGIRYDRTSSNGEFVSPSLGLTYNVTERSLLRGYVGRGYSLTSVLNSLFKEKDLAYQAGFETTDVSYLWLKATYFRTYALDATTLSGTNEKQVKQGVEALIKTLPLYNTALSAGFTFVDARVQESNAEIHNLPRYTWDLGMHYDDKRSFRGTLTGHYIWWNSDDQLNLLPGKYKAFIWDLTLMKKIFTLEEKAVELFFTGHNIFNGAQYLDGVFQNPRRWFEGGIRFKF